MAAVLVTVGVDQCQTISHIILYMHKMPLDKYFWEILPVLYCPPLCRFTIHTNMTKALRNLTAQSVHIGLTQNCLLPFDHGICCSLPPEQECL